MTETKLDDVFNALSDSNRLKILSIIRDNNEVCGCDILKELNITQPTLAYHMKILQDSKIVSCYKKGTWCVYSIEKDVLVKLNIFIDSLITKEN